MVFHDPCYLGRYRDIYEEPREVIARSGEVIDPRRARERSFCCGAGGGQMFLGEEKGKRVNVERAGELVATGAAVVGTACPFCQTMFRDAFGTVTTDAAQAVGHCADCRSLARVRGRAADAIILNWRAAQINAAGRVETASRPQTGA